MAHQPPVQAELPFIIPEVSQPQPLADQAPLREAQAPAAADQQQQPAAESDNPELWKSRYYGLQGRYTSAQKTIGEMQEQMTQLGNELLQAQQYVRPRQEEQSAPPPSQVTNYLTEQDVQNYGSDLVDFTQRAAAQALAPTLAQIEQQNAELQRRIAVEARRSMDARVEQAVPNFREIDRDPRWHRWLLGRDVYSGRIRQQLLNEAISTADASRAIHFFRGFQNEEAATGQSAPPPSSQQVLPPHREPAIDLATLAAPGRARPATGGDPSVPSDRPIYTRAQVAQLDVLPIVKGLISAVRPNGLGRMPTSLLQAAKGASDNPGASVSMT